MHPSIKVVREGRRGCGLRKLGGLYLRFDGGTMACGKLPIPLEKCPCCGGGIKLSRIPQMVDADMLFAPYATKECGGDCGRCPIAKSIQDGIGKALLITIGEKYYPTPKSFIEESVKMGVSRRITRIPRDFKIGETWVILAHKKAIADKPEFGKPIKFTPGVITMYLPNRIEIVVSGDEPDEVIEGYIKRGLTPVKVINDINTQEEVEWKA